MKYPKEYLDEIKTRLKVSTVVSKSVALKKRGKEYVGLSPFKTEKTPSNLKLFGSKSNICSSNLGFKGSTTPGVFLCQFSNSVTTIFGLPTK